MQNGDLDDLLYNGGVRSVDIFFHFVNCYFFNLIKLYYGYGCQKSRVTEHRLK